MIHHLKMEFSERGMRTRANGASVLIDPGYHDSYGEAMKHVEMDKGKTPHAALDG